MASKDPILRLKTSRKFDGKPYHLGALHPTKARAVASTKPGTGRLAYRVMKVKDGYATYWRRKD